MAWRHTITISRPAAGVQDVDGAWVPAGDPVVLYEGPGFLYHKTRTRVFADDGDAAAPSTGDLYIKDRKRMWDFRQGDVVEAFDKKLKITTTARLETMDHLVASFTVSDIRLVVP